jgi:hypothetical protein
MACVAIEEEETMMIGTCYFVSHFAAYKYYRAYGCTKEEVRRKIQDREIVIGFPPVKQGENIVIVDNGTRYAIQRED